LAAKQYLLRYMDAERHIAIKRRKIDLLREQSVGTSGAVHGARGKASAQGRIEACVEKILLLEREIDEARAAQETIRESLQRVRDEKLREVLELKYIYGRTLKEAARDMGYSHDWLKHLHLDALSAFEKDNTL